MKKLFIQSLLGLLTLSPSGFAAPVYTPPVGYITHTIAGNTMNGSKGADTYISPSLIPSDVFVGITTTAPAGSTVTVIGALPSNLDSTYLLEIQNGAREGWWSPITSVSGNTITLNDALPAAAIAGSKVAIRKITTISSFLGSNLPNLAQNDEVQLFDPLTQSTRLCVYIAGSGWTDLTSESNMNDALINPGTSIRIKRYAQTPLTFVSSGSVKATKTEIDLYPNANWVGQQLATGGTLSNMNLATQLLAYDTNPIADVIEILAPNQAATQYVVLSSGGILDLTSENNATSVPLQEGQGMIITRPSGSSPSVLIQPATTIN